MACAIGTTRVQARRRAGLLGLLAAGSAASPAIAWGVVRPGRGAALTARRGSLPAGPANGNLNTATFDLDGVLWFTGQNGIYGRLDPAVGDVEVFAAPGGRGPYGIATTPGGDVYYASLGGVGWGIGNRQTRRHPHPMTGPMEGRSSRRS